jgi:ABC-2 type transport system permease protein
LRNERTIADRESPIRREIRIGFFGNDQAVMRTFVHILRYKLLSYIKTTFDPHLVPMVRGLASLLVFGGFAYGTYLFAFQTTHFLLDQTRTGLYLFHMFLSMMLFVFFVAVNLGNIIVSYSTLYRSTEVGFLLTKPVSFTSIFVLKFLDNFFYSSTTLFLGAFMMLLGYGSYFGYSWYTMVGIMLFVLVPFMFLSACLSALILMAIMKIAGGIGFRKVMAGLFALYFFFIYLFFDASNPITLVEKLNRFLPNREYPLLQAAPEFLQYLPNQWVAEFLRSYAGGEIMHAVSYTALLLAATVVAFCLCLFVAHRFYYRSWLISLQVQSPVQKPSQHVRKHFIDFRSPSVFPSQVEVLLKKELLLFFREASQWIHFIVMIILTGLFSFSVSHMNLHLKVLDTQLITYLALYAFGGFMVSSLALRFVFPMIGLEGLSFWALRSSPVREHKIFMVKFLLWFLIILVLAEYIAISMNIPFVKFTEMRPLLLWFGFFSAFWISLTTVSLNLGFGGYFANYGERNPIRAASTQGATLTFLVTLIYLFILVVLIFVPISAYFTTLFKYHYFSMKLIVVPGTFFAVISYLLAAVGLIIGLKSLRRDL